MAVRGDPMAVKAMKGERREAFGAFTKRAEITDRHSLRTYIHYYCDFVDLDMEISFDCSPAHST